MCNHLFARPITIYKTIAFSCFVYLLLLGWHLFSSIRMTCFLRVVLKKSSGELSYPASVAQ